MSLATYSDLQTQVANWLARSGDTNISNNAADFITLAEARIAYGSKNPAHPEFDCEPLRLRAMETMTTLVVKAAVVAASGTIAGTNTITYTPTTAVTSYALGDTYQFTAAGSCTAGGVTFNVSGLGAQTVLKGSALSALAANDIVNAQTVTFYYDGTEFVYLPGTANVPLPSNFLAMRALYLDVNPRVELEYETPSLANFSFNSQFPDQPSRFTIEADTIRLDNAPDTAYYLPCLYYQKFGALSAATNWLMTNAPNAYLFASLLEASIFTRNWQAAEYYNGLYSGICNSLQSQNEIDRHSGGALFIRNETGNP